MLLIIVKDFNFVEQDYAYIYIHIYRYIYLMNLIYGFKNEIKVKNNF